MVGVNVCSIHPAANGSEIASVPVDIRATTKGNSTRMGYFTAVSCKQIFNLHLMATHLVVSGERETEREREWSLPTTISPEVDE